MAKAGLVAAALIVAAAMLWQGVVMSGAPDPSAGRLSPVAMSLSSAILVFREGLEAVLVLAAVTAGIVRNKKEQWRPVLIGSAAAILATVATWFIVVAIISSINAPALHVQAATGLLAIAVLLVVMNWFFHKVYWTGWICHHCNRRKRIQEDAKTACAAFMGFCLLGFTVIYREGFEIVLFLQDLRLKAGNTIVLTGAAVGLLLTLAVAALTFVAHQKVPYKKMLVLTGVMLGVVLIVMVGESMQEMQLAGWFGETPAPFAFPDWIGTWFATFANWEGLIAQALALVAVVGSYLFVRLRALKAT